MQVPADGKRCVRCPETGVKVSCDPSKEVLGIVFGSTTGTIHDLKN